MLTIFILSFNLSSLVLTYANIAKLLLKIQANSHFGVKTFMHSRLLVVPACHVVQLRKMRDYDHHRLLTCRVAVVQRSITISTC